MSELAQSDEKGAFNEATAPAPVGSPQRRYFEYVDGSSNKFWEVWVEGSDLTTRWGRIGTTGQAKTKNFITPEKARAERERLIAEKTGKGYREIGTTSQPSPGESGAARPSPPATAAVSQAKTIAPSDRLGASVAASAANNATALVCHTPRERAESTAQDVARHPTAEAASLPGQIHLQRTGEDPFRNREAEASLSRAIVRAGFQVAGSFTVRELPLVLRGFVRPPNATAVIFELGNLVWVDLTAFNADGTQEEWTSAAAHDGLVPSWSKITVVPHADFAQLHARMLSDHSGKPPATVDLTRFADLFEENYARLSQWRASRESPAPPAGQPSQEMEAQVVAFAHAYAASPVRHRAKPSEAVPAGAELLSLPGAQQVELFKACCNLQQRFLDSYRRDAVDELRDRLARRRLPYTDADLEYLAKLMSDTARHGLDPLILGVIEQYGKEHPLSEQTCQLLRKARDRSPERDYFGNDLGKFKVRIDVMVGDDLVRLPIVPREVWADAAIVDIDPMPPPQRAAWNRLIAHCVTATSGKPAAQWLRAAEPLVQAVTPGELRQYARKWFALVDKPWNGEHRGRSRNDPLLLVDRNQDILRGLVWCCSLETDEPTLCALGALAASAYRKIPQVGARAVRVGNACVFALGSTRHPSAVTQLAILKVKVKFGTAQRFIEQELAKAAERLGVPRDELEEMSVPACGLEEVGLRREAVGNFTAELSVSPTGSTEFAWLKPDGTKQKTVPAAVQKEFADELKELKAAAKEIQKMLPVQRERIDGLCLQQKSWPLEVWRERYFNHPLVGIVARRLIWTFHVGANQASAIFHRGKLVGRNDQPLEEFGEQTRVELWHPIGQLLEEIVAWRNFLETHELQQPFKQAHREVYLLTDAERLTRTYSNRFAAHIVRQAQLRALASARGWQCPLLGYWDGGDSTSAVRRLPQWELEAHLWINALNNTDEAVIDDAASATIGVPYVSTDQVRFCRTGEQANPLPLSEVPPLVFSEIMRDVDLFVGVASIGNDPTWSDGGPEGLHRDYWTSYSFGELSATAQTRRDVLERLVPRLRIADRCTFSDRFLIVRGDKRTYKIHLGSGNILMLPDDQYLCIVPDQVKGRGGTLLLPFEGDITLSIILSKALLLAEDTRITDPSILSQIDRR